MKSDDRKDLPNQSEAKPNEKKDWRPMKLRYTGEAKDLIQHGVGKDSTSPGDPGEALKVPGH